ncbi:MAG TPA: diacylglycerol kinase [Lachnospiraceae bacterium]|nr:diacylglycerol kinase [Lachnospiraceae bacterium]
MSENLKNSQKPSLYGENREKEGKILFIFNPVSGKAQIRNDLLDILQILSGTGYKLECYPTKCSGDARNLLRNRTEDYVYVACSGGDGTLDEVVGGLMENTKVPRVPIGYIPSGTTNDFASSLGIPSDMKAAANVIATGRPYDCDLGKFNDDAYFTYVAAFGLFTETSYETPQDLKNQLGHVAYILQGMVDLGKIRTYRFKVECDELAITDEFVFGMITNSKSVGGFADITGNQVDMSDGLFEVTLIKMPANILELNDIVQYLTRAVDVSDLVYQFKTSHIVLESDERVKWTRDGEFGGNLKRVELTNLHKALQILAPERS